VFAVLPSVVSIFDPEILNEEPILDEVARAASTVSWTLAACLVTSPPAFAALAVNKIIANGMNFFILPIDLLSIYM
jgi:succinyl-CoA synthetase alpha subunit